MQKRDKNLTILTDTEKHALYGLPDFDKSQRSEYFSMTAKELALAMRRQGFSAQLLCLLQLGYFKAKQAFFTFTLQDIPKDDIEFLVERYFSEKPFSPGPVRQKEYFVQHQEIVKLFGYNRWSEDKEVHLLNAATQLALRDVTPAFIVSELLVFMKSEKIIRPGYTTLQALISKVLITERQRLGNLIKAALDEEHKAALLQLLERESGLSDLASIKQDAKSFRYRMMVTERRKHTTLSPLYLMAKAILPRLGLSQQNLLYYASLANYYTIYDLRRMNTGQSFLYLLCYIWQRYKQISDNITQAFSYHMKQVETGVKDSANKRSMEAMNDRQQALPLVGRLLNLYVDEDVSDSMPFGEVRQEAFTIMPKDALLLVSTRLTEKPVNKMELSWQAIDLRARKIKLQLRPLVSALDFLSVSTDSPWLAALNWMKNVFDNKGRLSQQLLSSIPEHTIPKRIRPYLLILDDNGVATGLRGERYEFWVYRQLRKRLDTGELYLDDSFQHRRFSDELVPLDRQEAVLQGLDIAWLKQPVEATLDAALAELDKQWCAFDRELRQGKLKHLDYSKEKKTLVWHRPKANLNRSKRALVVKTIPDGIRYA